MVVDSFYKPRLVVSRCLELAPVRYDGVQLVSTACRALYPYVEVVDVCPEVAIGLGTPRPKIRLVPHGDGVQLLQPETGRELTTALDDFALDFVQTNFDIDGFVLKSASPSCGIGTAKIYDGREGEAFSHRTHGRFARGMLAGYPQAAFIDEDRLLSDMWAREIFLTRLFASARLRALSQEATSLRDLIRFHADNKMLLLAFDEPAMRALGQVVAMAADLQFEQAMARYVGGFKTAMEKHPTIGSLANALQHLAGHFERETPLAEARDELHRHIAALLESGSIASLQAARSLLCELAAKDGNDYVGRQNLLSPYPKLLASFG